MADEKLSIDDLRALRVVDLKEKLSALGLLVGGRKEELVQRLAEYYESQGEDGDADVAEEEPEDVQEVEELPEVVQDVEEPEPVPVVEEEPEVSQGDGGGEIEQEAPEDIADDGSQDVVVQHEEPVEVAPEDSTPMEEEDDDDEPAPEVEAEHPSQGEPEQEEEVTEVLSSSPEVQEVSENLQPEVSAPSAAKPVRTSLLSVPLAPPPFVGRSQAVGPPVPMDGDLDGPPTPAGPLPKTSAGGPVPLMSLAVKPPPKDPSSEAHRGDEPTKGSLPKALEEVLAFKSERTRQVGLNLTEVEEMEVEATKNVSLVDEGDDDDEDEVELQPRGKDNRRQRKKKKKKRNRQEEWAKQAAEAEEKRKESEVAEQEPKVEVEYVPEKLELDFSDPLYRQFAKIFETFKIAEEDEAKDTIKVEKHEDSSLTKESGENEVLTKVPKELELDEEMEQREKDSDAPKLSKRKLKKLSRLSVAELKQLVTRPDVVEMHDVTAKDPGLLVHLKSYRNTVPVPRHWCFKRKYLQGKRGIEKPPFDLPDFIKRTGIMEMRAALQEKEEAKNLKSKMREKVRPKLGKIDIDYQKLHDAFFKWQTKPKMTSHGDLYYEGKEFEIRLKEKKPGDISDDLRTALGMPVGPNAHKVPPPWLIAMQRYGPPPSYPNLKIAGLNAPIPEGCSFGYHAGGWGKPPVDETGKPLYGDVFGTSDPAHIQQLPQEDIDQNLWGELESESEEEESEEEEEEEEEEEGDVTGLQTPVVDAGLATPSGISSVGGQGLETPELIELRKRKIEADMEGGETPSLYTILPERHQERIAAGMMGSTHTYDIPPPPPPLPSHARGGARPPPPPSSAPDLGVELALNPEEVDLMDTEAMTARAEAALRESQAMLGKEDLSDMVAEHAAKQSSKRKRQAAKEDSKANKKYKEFKF